MKALGFEQDIDILVLFYIKLKHTGSVNEHMHQKVKLLNH